MDSQYGQPTSDLGYEQTGPSLSEADLLTKYRAALNVIDYKS